MSFKGEKEKLRTMSFKDKLWYICTYYKFHIGLAILIIGLPAWIFLSGRGDNLNPHLYVITINNRLMSSTQKQIKNDFAEYAGLDTTKEELVLNTDFTINIENSTVDTYSYLMKLSTWIASKQLDIMITDYAVINHYAGMNGLLDLEQILPDDLKHQLSDYFYYTDDEDGNQKAYGIIIEDSQIAPLLTALNPPVLGIVSTTENLNEAITFLSFLFE